MTYWQAIGETKISKKGAYIIYLIKDQMRFSYVNQYKNAYEYIKREFMFGKTNYYGVKDLTAQDKAIVENLLKEKDVIYYQKEKWDNTKGWICVSRTKEPDDEFLHYIISEEWELSI